MSIASYQGVTSAAATGSPSDWPGSPLSTLHHETTQPQVIPLEQYPEGASYVIRLEIPGVDPVNGLTVTVETGTLSVQAERHGSAPAGSESEFRYGTFARHVALPLGANVQDVSATCRNGVLTVRIGMTAEHDHTPRAINVATEP